MVELDEDGAAIIVNVYRSGFMANNLRVLCVSLLMLREGFHPKNHGNHPVHLFRRRLWR